MSMIKCPECGHQISDKAPVCPNCGVEIAGKIIRCPQCGEIYFKDQEMCPNCHHLTKLSGTVGNTTDTPNTPTPRTTKPVTNTSVPPKPQAQRTERTGTTPPVPPRPTTEGNGQGEEKPKKKHTVLIVSFVFALVVCALCFYFYSNAKESKEQEAYEFAMKSDDPIVLQTYLDSYKDAPVEHIDSIVSHLERLKQLDADWNNAVVSGSKQALLDYLQQHPNSEHKADAERKIDSIDWGEAQTQNTMQALQAYLTEHPNGNYVDAANDALRQVKANTVQPDEKTMVTQVLRQFFQAINARNEAGLETTVAPLLTNFLGKADATKSDVVTFMDKIYKDDITNMNWHIGNDMKIDKREVGDEQYEYTATFSASQDITRTDPDKEKHANYKIKATIDPDGQISSMTMKKILE